MKRLALALTAVTVLGTAGFFSQGQSARPPQVAWQGDLATIAWTEPLADPKAAPGEVPFSLLGGPQIGWLTDTQATISWEVIGRKGVTDVFKAPMPANTDLNNIQFRSAVLKDLKPDMTYRYRLTAANGRYRYASQEYRFRTLPPRTATKLRFAVVGDTQRFAQQPWTDINRRLFKDMQKWDPALVLHLGDVVYDSWGPGINGRKGWFRFFDLCRDLRASTFMAPVMGNHDITVNQKVIWGPTYFADLPAQQNNAAGQAQPPFYYSFDVANVHFVALCTELRRTGPKKEDLADAKVYDRFTYKEQVAWLEEDLRSSRAPWKIAFFHQPLHTVGGYPARPEFRADFGRLFDKYRVPVILSGHDHSYQRTWRVRNASREKADDGSIQIISGGASNLFTGKSAPWNVLHARVNHYLRAEIDGDTLRVDAVLDDGSVFESWQMRTTGQPVTLRKAPDVVPEPAAPPKKAGKGGKK